VALLLLLALLVLLLLCWRRRAQKHSVTKPIPAQARATRNPVGAGLRSASSGGGDAQAARGATYSTVIEMGNTMSSKRSLVAKQAFVPQRRLSGHNVPAWGSNGRLV